MFSNQWKVRIGEQMNYRILVVEDDFALAKIMKQQIELWGNEVSLVTDFQNVLSTFLAYDPQLVLMDIKLPFFNGYHWCSEIRKVSNVLFDIFISQFEYTIYFFLHFVFPRGEIPLAPFIVWHIKLVD